MSEYQILGSLENQNLLPPLLKQAPWSSVFTVSAILFGFSGSREGSIEKVPCWSGCVCGLVSFLPLQWYILLLSRIKGTKKKLRLVILKEWLLG